MPESQFTLEQEASLAMFQLAVNRMTERQAKFTLMVLRREMVIQQNIHKELLKKHWGI